MKRSNLLVMIAATFVGGAVFGWLIGRSHDRESPPGPSSVVAGETSRPREEIDGLREENRRLAERLKNAEGARLAESRASFTPLEEMKVLAGLQQRKLLKPGIRFIDRAGKLDPAFLGVFAVTPTERERLQQAVDDARTKLAALAQTNAKITRDDQGRVVVAIPPFPSEGGKVYDGMMQIFSEVLGPERTDAYQKIEAEQAETALGKFGAAEHTYVFGYETGKDGGRGLPYTLQDKVVQQLPNGGRDSVGNNTAFHTFDELSAYVGPVISMLPPDFNRGK